MEGIQSCWRYIFTCLLGSFQRYSQLSKFAGRGSPRMQVPVGGPRPYSIIILNMRFIPKAAYGASSQLTTSSYILERHRWVNNSTNFKALVLSWAFVCEQTDCITAGISEISTRADPTLVLTPSKHRTFVWLYTMLEQRWSRWANVELMLYKCFVFPGQEDFLSHIVHFSNGGSMLGQRRRRWPNIGPLGRSIHCYV